MTENAILRVLPQTTKSSEASSMKPIPRPMPSISYIVARSNPGGVIGCENRLPWKLRTDMKFFRKVTEGHVVIMGRKTYESLGRPLPNRMNIVLSRSAEANKDNLLWVDTLESALYAADIYSILNECPEIIVIGGAQIYQIFSELFTKIYLTEVYHHFASGDAYFNTQFDKREWETVERISHTASDVDEHDFTISVMVRKRKYIRHRADSEFFVGNDHGDIRSLLPRVREKLRIESPIESMQQSIFPMLVA